MAAAQSSWHSLNKYIYIATEENKEAWACKTYVLLNYCIQKQSTKPATFRWVDSTTCYTFAWKPSPIPSVSGFSYQACQQYPPHLCASGMFQPLLIWQTWWMLMYPHSKQTEALMLRSLLSFFWCIHPRLRAHQAQILSSFVTEGVMWFVKGRLLLTQQTIITLTSMLHMHAQTKQPDS